MAFQLPNPFSCSSVSGLQHSLLPFSYICPHRVSASLFSRPVLPLGICRPLTSASALRGKRDLDSLPPDLKAALDAGHVTAETMWVFLLTEGSPLLCRLLYRCLLHFDRILADHLFLPKLTMACAVITKVGIGATNGLIIAMKTIVKDLDNKVEKIPAASIPDKVEKIPAASTPDKVEQKWWSFFEAGAEVSAGLVLTESPMRGRLYQPAAMSKLSASFSRGSSGVSRKNGKA